MSSECLFPPTLWRIRTGLGSRGAPVGLQGHYADTLSLFCLSRALTKSVKVTLAGKSRRVWRRQPRLPSSQLSRCPRVGPSKPFPR